MTDHCNVCVYIVQFWSVIKIENNNNKLKQNKKRKKEREKERKDETKKERKKERRRRRKDTCLVLRKKE